MKEYKEVTLPMIKNAKAKLAFYEISSPEIEEDNLRNFISDILKEEDGKSSDISTAFIYNSLKGNHNLK